MAERILRTRSAGKPKLLDQVRDVIRRKHYSIRTEQAYIDWIKRFIIYHGKRHPGEMAEVEVSEFLTYFNASVRQFHTRDVCSRALRGQTPLSFFPQEFGWIDGNRS
jgi:hypothetical protein